MAIVIRVLINAAALWVAVAIVDGLQFDFGEHSVWSFLGVALIMGVVNVIVRPIVTILALPAILLTLGLFLLVVNGIVFWVVIALSESLDLGLTSDGFGWTMLGALIISLVSWGIEALLGRS